MIFVGNRDDAKGQTETFIEELISVFLGLALCQALMDFMIEEYPMDLDWLDNYYSKWLLSWTGNG